MTWNRIQAQDNDIKLLQDNLSSLRRIAGWDQEALAVKLGVPKSTIAGFEREKSVQMARVYYIAIMALFDKEIQSNKNNDLLAQAMTILFGQDDKEIEPERKELAQAAISVIGASVAESGDKNGNRKVLYKSLLKDASGSAGIDATKPMKPLGWLQDPEVKEGNEARRERIMRLFGSKEKRKSLLKALPCEGLNVDSVLKCLEPELLSKADSLICKSLFEDIWDERWQSKRVPSGADKSLAELKITLELNKPERDKQLYLFGLLCGEKFLAYSRAEGKDYIKFKLYRAYRRFEEEHGE